MKVRHMFLVLAGVAVLFSRPAPAADGPFRVTATTSTNRVQLKKPFTLYLRVKNVSASTQEFETLVCSWWANWTLDNAYLQFPMWDCDFHPPYKVILRPGASWTNEVDMKISKSIPTNHLSLRVGFSPAVVNPNRDKNPMYQWSNEVRLELAQ